MPWASRSWSDKQASRNPPPVPEQEAAEAEIERLEERRQRLLGRRHWVELSNEEQTEARDIEAKVEQVRRGMFGVDSTDTRGVYEINVTRPEGWGAIEVGNVVVLWSPTDPEREDFATFDTLTSEVEQTYQHLVDKAQREHDEAVEKAEEKLRSSKVNADTSGKEATRKFEEAEKAYDVEVLAADDALTSAKWSLSRQMERDIAKNLRTLFARSAPERFVLYRVDEDLWVEASDANEAAELAAFAIDDYRGTGEVAIGRVALAQKYGRGGAIVARFDPSKVFRGGVPVASHTRRVR